MSDSGGVRPGGGTALPTLTDTATLYLAATGNDANDGRSWATAYATLGAAYTYAVAHAPMKIKCGVGTFPFSANLFLGQGVDIEGSGDVFSGQGSILQWTGADDATFAITACSNNVGADATGKALRDARVTCAAAKPGGGAYALKAGLNLRNWQNGSAAKRLQVSAFPGDGVKLDGTNGVAPIYAFPGYVLLEQIWVTNCGVNWRSLGGFTSVLFVNCAGDFGALTTDIFVIDPPAAGSGKYGNLIFEGFKTEPNGPADQDLNFFTVNTDVGLSFTGCSAHKSTTGTKPWINYTVVPSSANTVTGQLPVTLVNCSTQNIPVAVQSPAGASLLAPTVVAGGDVFQIAFFNGQAVSAASPISANALTAGIETISRLQTSSNAATTLGTGTTRFAYFTAPQTRTINTITVRTGSTAAGATPTLIRYGLFTVAANGDLTLVASTVNDTTMLAAINTWYPKALSAGYQVTAGLRYAVGVLVVTAAAAPTLCGLSLFAGIGGAGDATWIGTAPVIAAHIGGQADLGNVLHGSLLTGEAGIFYAACT